MIQYLDRHAWKQCTTGGCQSSTTRFAERMTRIKGLYAQPDRLKRTMKTRHQAADGV